MRLKISLKCERCSIPMNYQPLLQGLIYAIFDQEKYGKFLHDEGYRTENKVFKLFTFSNLFGNYELDKDYHMFLFKEKFHFYMSSYSEEFMQKIYDFFSLNHSIVLHNQIVNIEKIDFCEIPHFFGNKEIVLRTISPLVAYRTENKYVTYLKPSHSDFELYCLGNINEKNKALCYPVKDVQFKILNVEYEKKRFVKFKNTFYESYLAEIKVMVNYETLLLIYNTGLASKGPSGFGMIEVKK